MLSVQTLNFESSSSSHVPLYLKVRVQSHLQSWRNVPPLVSTTEYYIVGGVDVTGGGWLTQPERCLYKYLLINSTKVLRRVFIFNHA